MGLSAQDRRGPLRDQFLEYLAEAFDRDLDQSPQVWTYWSSSRRRWPLLAMIVLILLAAPIGNSELERSFSLVKRTSLDPHRQNASAENKSVMNRAHVNKELNLYPLGPSS
jgi:hAT family C-terminal dimerisation region